MFDLQVPDGALWRRGAKRRAAALEAARWCAAAVGLTLSAPPWAGAVEQVDRSATEAEASMLRSDGGGARDGVGLDAAAYALVPGPFQRGPYAPAQLQYGDTLGGGALRLRVRLFGAQQRSTDVLHEATPFSFVAPGDNVGAALGLSYTGVAAHTLTVGAEALVPAEAGTDAHYSAYAQDEWRWSAHVTGTLGMRVARTGAAFARPSALAAVVWQAQPATRLSARYGRAYPADVDGAYASRWSRLGQPGEHGGGIGLLEASVDQRFDGEWLLRAVAYQWSVDEVPASPASADGAQGPDVGRIVAHGLELSADKRWPRGSRLRGSVAMQRARSADGSWAPNAPGWSGALDFLTRLPFAGLQLGCELRYDITPRGADGVDGVGSAVSNLRVRSDRLVDGLEIGVSVDNLLNLAQAEGQSNRGVRLEALYRF